jgi:hypothetical protein
VRLRSYCARRKEERDAVEKSRPLDDAVKKMGTDI